MVRDLLVRVGVLPQPAVALATAPAEVTRYSQALAEIEEPAAVPAEPRTAYLDHPAMLRTLRLYATQVLPRVHQLVVDA